VPLRRRLRASAGDLRRRYCYDGALYDWNWETGASRSVLAESRDVVRCRFIDGQRAALLLRPRDDDEYGEAEAYKICVGGVLEDLGPAPYLDEDENDRVRDPRLAAFAPIAPRAARLRRPSEPVAGPAGRGARAARAGRLRGAASRVGRGVAR
jgi:hypothetical protein